MQHFGDRLNIAVIGTGIAGMSAAWLLSRAHRVTVYEAAARLGGHSHTIDLPESLGGGPLDTGFIVYNERTYPNLTALFGHLEVATKPSDMSFSVSLDDGALKYSGGDLRGLFAQKRNGLFGICFQSFLLRTKLNQRILVCIIGGAFYEKFARNPEGFRRAK